MPFGRLNRALVQRKFRGALLRVFGAVATRVPVPAHPELLAAAFAAGAATRADRVLHVDDDPARAAAMVERMHQRGLASARADVVLLEARRRLTARGGTSTVRKPHRIADRLRARSPDQLADEAEKVFAEGRAGRRAVVSYLLAADQFDLAAHFLGRLPANELPVRLAGSAVKRARRAGNLTATVAIADRVLAVSRRSAAVRELAELSRDELQVLDRGLPVEPLGTTPYEPGERRVLALLEQSLPIMSGGYATRTDGILRGLAGHGWNVRAVTRYGFPYDRWLPVNRRTVPLEDEVNGIVYQRLLDGDRRVYPKAPLTGYIDAYADRVVAAAVNHRARLLHASSLHLNGLAGAVAARRLGIPSVYEMRGLEALVTISLNPDYADSERHRFLMEMERQCCLRADHVLVITEALRAEMVQRGVPEQQMTVLPNGVATGAFQPRERDSALASQLGLSGRTVIGYVGGMVFYEGLELLLEAVARLRTRRDDFAVLIVGDGPQQDMVHREAGRLRVRDLVTFTGRVPHAQVGRYLSLVDVAPFPRLPLQVCELITPMKPLESMAMGKAVVVSDVAALTEFVTDDVTGLTFRKGDPEHLTAVLDRLVGDPELRARLGAGAQRWVRAEREWSTITKRADDIYDQLLASRERA